MAQDASPTRVIVGRYRLGRILGRGAHGVVHLAEDLGRAGRQVALKVMPHGAGGPDLDDAAARHLRWFRHPSWAEVLDTGSVDEKEWFQALRYVDGTSLEALQGPQDSALVWKFLEDGARVLGAIHRMGLIHYDVTPGNFLLEWTPEGLRFVLTDGGLAHFGPVQNQLRGTPLFCAPEMTEDVPHDHRVDLYALGLVAFRLVAGRDPFGDAESLHERKVRTAPDLRSLRPETPEGLARVIADLLARDPRDRIPSTAALREALSTAQERPVEPVTTDVMEALLEGGPLSGHGQLLDDLQDSFAASAAALSERGSKTHIVVPPIPLPPVLLLTGAPGSGGTRLLAEICHRARQAGNLVLRLAGRDDRPDSQAPLKAILEGVRSLPPSAEGDADQTVETPRFRTRRDRAYSKSKRIDEFVETVLDRGGRSPLLLAVEDFQELPSTCQEAVHALCRDMLSRKEHFPGAELPHVMIVVDAGESPTEPFLPPTNAADPSRYTYRLSGLGTTEISYLLQTRFPLLEVTQTDADALRRMAGGTPKSLIQILLAGTRQGKITLVDGVWTMGPTPWDQIDLPQALPSSSRYWPRTWRGPYGKLLAHLALLESGLPLEQARRITGGAAIPSSPLLVKRFHHGIECVALANQRIRQSLLGSIPAAILQTASRTLTGMLLETPTSDSVFEYARITISLGESREAVATLHTHETLLDSEARFSMQRLLLEAAPEGSELLQDAAWRAKLAALLERGPDAVALAQRLADHLEDPQAEITTLLRVAEVLEDARDATSAMDLLRRVRDSVALPWEGAVALALRKSRLAFDQRYYEFASTGLDEAKTLLSNRSITSSHRPDLRAEYFSLLARRHYLVGNFKGAFDALASAAELAERSGELTLQARLLNNLSNAAAALDEDALALQYATASRALKRKLGDVKGEVVTTTNIARLHKKSGAYLDSLAPCQEAVQLAQRFGLLAKLTEALRLLASTYDCLHRPSMALDCLLRASTLLPPHSSSTAAVLWELAPLASALGRAEEAERALRLAATIARGKFRADSARAQYNLAACQVALHVGAPSAARRYIVRATRHISTLTQADAYVLTSLAQTLGGDSSLPRIARDPRLSTALASALEWAETDQSQQTSPPSTPYAVPPIAGTDGRLAYEILMHAARRRPSDESREIVQHLRAQAHRCQFSLLAARASALQAVLTPNTDSQGTARLFSTAVQTLVTSGRYRYRALRSVPEELLSAASLLQESAPYRPNDEPYRNLQAVAHQALLSAGTTPYDDRRAVALKRVLEAGAQLRAGSDVQTMLQSITRHILDITSAQRVCFVLVDGTGGWEQRLASFATDSGRTVALDDLSQSVINRVLSAKEQLHLPFLPSDSGTDAGVQQALKRSGIAAKHSILCTPIIRRQEILGVLYADSATSAEFDQVDEEVMFLFAEQAAAAIEASRLIEDLQRTVVSLKEAQERLVQGERLQVLGEVTSGVAHEFNNYLTAIQARIHMLRLASHTAEVDENLALIQTAVDDAVNVVRRLQSYSRRKTRGDFEIVDLHEVCRDTVALLRPLWMGRVGLQRAITVTLDCTPNLTVFGSSAELREVLTNLIKNSLDAVGMCGKISLVGRRNLRTVEIEVRDNGPGIEDTDLARVFEPFFTTKGERGTGLGLPLSRQIVERHGGTVVITSTPPPGGGTAVKLTFPAMDARTRRSRPRQVRKALRTKANVSVLLVDDEGAVLESVARFLTRQGFTVAKALNAETALSKLQAQSFDVMVTDYSLGSIDGIELTRRVRRASHIPIVIMSGYTSELEQEAAREAGVSAVLQKPPDLEALTQLLRQLATSETKPA